MPQVTCVWLENANCMFFDILEHFRFPALASEGSPARKRAISLNLVPNFHTGFRQVEENPGNVVAAFYGEI